MSQKAELEVKLTKGYDIKLEKKSLEDFNEECLWGTTGDEAKTYWCESRALTGLSQARLSQ